MLVKKKFNNELELLNFLRGETVVAARTGTNAATSTTFTDATGTPFASAAIGDILHISGDATEYTVGTVTDDNNLVVAPAIAAANLTDTSYRLVRGPTPLAGFVFGPVADPTQSGVSWGILDVVDFG